MLRRKKTVKKLYLLRKDLTKGLTKKSLPLLPMMMMMATSLPLRRYSALSMRRTKKSQKTRSPTRKKSSKSARRSLGRSLRTDHSRARTRSTSMLKAAPLALWSIISNQMPSNPINNQKKKTCVS